MDTYASISGISPATAAENVHAITFREMSGLLETARNAIENHRLGILSLWMLGVGMVGTIIGGSLYFLAVSPIVIRALGPLF